MVEWQLDPVYSGHLSGKWPKITTGKTNHFSHKPYMPQMWPSDQFPVAKIP
jgi:hypothetical protein